MPVKAKVYRTKHKVLEGRTVIVTGASGGIGSATAIELAECGANVAATDIFPAAEELMNKIEKIGGTALYVPADVRYEAQIEAVVAKAIETFGRLDGAFNNAGVEQVAAPLHEITVEQWRRAIDIDLTGIFICLKFEINAMLRAGGGSIVNTSSVFGLGGSLLGGEYIAAKHGVVGLTKAAAVDYASKNIRGNAVAPGGTLTPMVQRALSIPEFAAPMDALRKRHPMGRYGEPQEIAEAVKWLLSDASSYVTGTTLIVDGGYLAG
jgi:NAD(P)-dependent dehydrogenase (short-subunit alcohol dehydrogenase family)